MYNSYVIKNKNPFRKSKKKNFFIISLSSFIFIFIKIKQIEIHLLYETEIIRK